MKLEIPTPDEADDRFAAPIKRYTSEEPKDCQRLACCICAKQIYICTCHDLQAGPVFTGAWVCGLSCWLLFCEKWNVRSFTSKQTNRTVNAMRRAHGQPEQPLKTGMQVVDGLKLCEVCEGKGLVKDEQT